MQKLRNRKSVKKIKQINKQISEKYRAEVKNIPSDVKLHVLLTKIIQHKEYTAEERKELNDLVRDRD